MRHTATNHAPARSGQPGDAYKTVTQEAIDHNILVTLCTCPDSETAGRLAQLLVERRLAACVNILPGITSVYLWDAAVQRDSEVLMVIKTTSQKYRQLEATLRESHPYEVPEIIATPVTEGLASYLEWVGSTVEEKLW